MFNFAAPNKLSEYIVKNVSNDINYSEISLAYVIVKLNKSTKKKKPIAKFNFKKIKRRLQFFYRNPSVKNNSRLFMIEFFLAWPHRSSVFGVRF